MCYLIELSDIYIDTKLFEGENLVLSDRVRIRFWQVR